MDFIAGIGVLVLLSIFFAYVLAPAVAALRLRLRFGPRPRPPSNAIAIVIVYVVLFVPVALVWRSSADRVSHWVRVTAPEAVEELFGGGGSAVPPEEVIARVPPPAGDRQALAQRLTRVLRCTDRETRGTPDDLIGAAEYARWLAVAPLLAFLLLTGAPGFQRSTLRVLPRGHLQWRAEEYLRDVNSALAGYIRAQAAAGVIVGTACVCGFALLRVPSAVSMGVAAGVLELVPALGPLTALIMASSQAGGHVVGVVVFLGAELNSIIRA